MCTSVPVQKNAPSDGSMDVLKNTMISLIRCLIVQIHLLFDCIVHFVFGLYYSNKVKKVPPVKNELLLDSAVELAKKIRTGKVTSEEIVKAFIQRCKEVNGIINAVTEDRFEDAIAEAVAVDKLIQNSVDIQELQLTKPFLGVPFTTKESNEAEGLLHTMGLISRKNHRSKEDATVVKYLKNAGAILIAKTNVPELNLWCESRNNVYGQTGNPYNNTRIVGGSSGGEGAITAACGTAFSIGSDIGGSTRMPAYFNGVFGHKPSAGLTMIKGIGLRQKDHYNSMVEAGPICKKAEDLIPFLKVLIGDNVSKVTLDKPVDLKKINVFYQTKSGDIRASKVNKTMRNTMMKAVNYFKELTGSATKVKIPGSEYSFRLWRYWMSQEEADFKYDITNQRYRTSAKHELYKLITGKSELTIPAILKLIDEDFLPKDDPHWAERVTKNMKQYLTDKLGDNGVLFYTSYPSPAPYHYSPILSPFSFGYWALFNVLKFPVCQVPLGLDDQGLPVGIQVVAAPYNDHLCLAVAKELEKAFGGWVQP